MLNNIKNVVLFLALACAFGSIVMVQMRVQKLEQRLEKDDRDKVEAKVARDIWFQEHMGPILDKMKEEE